MPRIHSRRYSLPGLAAAAATCVALFTVLPAAAEEQVLEFLHAAQDRGYGEIAIDYLEMLKAAGKLPRELAESYDLELSRSYRVAVGEAFNAAETEDRMAKAQKHLDKFLKEHPDHPEVARAMESWGDLGLERGLQRIRQTAATKDAAQKEKLLTAARADLAEARPRFADAEKRYHQQLVKLKESQSADGKGRSRATTGSAARRARQAETAVRDAEIAWLECRFKTAKIDYYTAGTYLDPKARERKPALEAAAKAFDAVFQSYRESLVGLHAHLWHGRAADALGNDQLALDIYDEVLATAPEGRERETGLEPLFAQAQYYRLLVLLRKEGAEKFLAEATPWLELRRVWKKYDGYQGVLLEVAKVHLAQAAEQTGSRKTALTQSALTTLADVAKLRGEHQQAAILLRRQHTRGGGPSTADPATAKTFDEAMALGEEASENLDWAGAAAMFARAMELNPGSDAKRASQAGARLDQARYQLAAAQYAEGKFDQSLNTAEQIARDRPDAPLAPQASSLAVSAALSLYARAQDKPAAFARLDALAAEMIKRWPDKAEADDARIALGQASLVRGELAAAAAVFEKVNPRSLRYPAAMFLAGQTNWRMYQAAKGKAGGAADASSLDAMRTTAEKELQTSLDAQRKASEANPSAASQLVDTQLLLAELKLEAGRADEAAKLVEPLVASIKAEKPKSIGNTQLRVILAAARAQAALGQMDNVAAAARVLVELGEDDAAVNGVLNALLKLAVDAWKQAEAETIEARAAGDAARRAAAEATAGERKRLVVDCIAAMAPRKQNTLAALIYIADTAAQAGQADTARELFEAIRDQAASDPAFKKANGQALTRIQAQLVGLLRAKGQFAEALAQANELIEKYPNALEPLMEKGRTLQAWADVEPKRFDDAVAHWTMLRTRLARMTRKPPEYYEVVFSAASCLFTDSLKNNNPQKALQAEQLLNATLVLAPKLSGPEMVARYKELLVKARTLQGRTSDASARNQAK